MTAGKRPGPPSAGSATRRRRSAQALSAAASMDGPAWVFGGQLAHASDSAIAAGQAVAHPPPLSAEGPDIGLRTGRSHGLLGRTPLGPATIGATALAADRTRADGRTGFVAYGGAALVRRR